MIKTTDICWAYSERMSGKALPKSHHSYVEQQFSKLCNYPWLLDEEMSFGSPCCKSISRSKLNLDILSKKNQNRMK